MKIVINLIGEMTENKECQCPTPNITNCDNRLQSINLGLLSDNGALPLPDHSNSEDDMAGF